MPWRRGGQLAAKAAVGLDGRRGRQAAARPRGQPGLHVPSGRAGAADGHALERGGTAPLQDHRERVRRPAAHLGHGALPLLPAGECLHCPPPGRRSTTGSTRAPTARRCSQPATHLPRAPPGRSWRDEGSSSDFIGHRTISPTTHLTERLPALLLCERGSSLGGGGGGHPVQKKPSKLARRIFLLIALNYAPNLLHILFYIFIHRLNLESSEIILKA